MIETCLKISSASEIHRIKDIVNTIISYISASSPYVLDEDIFDLRLIYSELLANAMIHGNKNDFSKNVSVFIQISPDAIWSEVTDEGNGFNYSELLEDGDGDLLFESGRGIKIVKSLTTLLKFNKKGNSVEFYKNTSAHTSELSQSLFDLTGCAV